MEETDLLRCYVREKSEDAFRELVRREIPLVYSAALRQVGGDANLAEEVVQAVFTALATKAHRIMKHPSLAGWLHTSTHFAAAKLLRSERRRRHHEARAVQETPVAVGPTAPQSIAWQEVSEVLDAAVRDLRESDRQAVLLRFFEGHTLAAVGARLGLSEDGARKRIDRALEQLKSGLERRGLTCTATALSATLVEGAIATVPTGLAASTATGALTAVAAGEVVVAAGILFTMKKFAVAGIAVALLATTTTVLLVQQNRRRSNLAASPSSMSGARNELAPAPDAARLPAPQSVVPPSPVAASLPSAAGDGLDLDRLIAEVVDDRKKREAALVAMGIRETAKADADLYRETMARKSAANPDVVPPAAVSPASLAALGDPNASLAYFRRFSPEDLLAHLQYIQEALPSDRRQVLAPALFQAWFERNPDSALAAASPGNPSNLLSWALSGWAAADLPAAWNWLASAQVTQTQRSNLRRAVIDRGVAAGQESALASWIESGASAMEPGERKAAVNNLITAWSPRDFPAAEGWLREMDATHQGTFAQAAVSLGGGAAKLPSEELDRLLARQDDETWGQIMSGAIWALVGTDQTERLHSLLVRTDTLNDIRHDRVLRSLAVPLESKDADLAFEIYRRLRDAKSRDEMLGSLGGAASASSNPELTVQALLAIQDRTVKARRFIDTYLALREQNPDAARKFLDQPSFPSDIRARLLEQGPE